MTIYCIAQKLLCFLQYVFDTLRWCLATHAGGWYLPPVVMDLFEPPSQMCPTRIFQNQPFVRQLKTWMNLRRSVPENIRQSVKGVNCVTIGMPRTIESQICSSFTCSWDSHSRTPPVQRRLRSNRRMSKKIIKTSIMYHELEDTGVLQSVL
jgi:hypothetical protein